jgi:hypothetical protein
LIRTFWFAAICLAGLGGLLAAKVTSSVATAEESLLDSTVLDLGRADDTLTKADRLAVAYLAPAAPIPSAGIIPELPTESVSALPARPRAIANSQHPAANRQRNDVILPRPRPKIRLTKVSRPARPAVDVKTCSQAEGLGGILLSFAGTPRCG